MAAAAVWQRQQMCGVGCPVASAWQYQHGSVIAVAGQRKCGIVSVQAAEAGTPHLRYGAAGETGGLVAYPKGRPHPQDPKGGAGATPRHTALRRGEGGRWPTRRAAPTPQDPKGGADATPRHPAPR